MCVQNVQSALRWVEIQPVFAQSPSSKSHVLPELRSQQELDAAPARFALVARLLRACEALRTSAANASQRTGVVVIH